MALSPENSRGRPSSALREAEIATHLEFGLSVDQLFCEIQDIVQSQPDYPMTIPHVASRLIPDLGDSSIPSYYKETWLHMMMTELIRQQRIRMTTTKVLMLGQHYPTFELISSLPTEKAA